MLTYIIIGAVVMVASHIVDYIGSLNIPGMTDLMHKGPWSSPQAFTVTCVIRVITWPITAILSSLSVIKILTT